MLITRVLSLECNWLCNFSVCSFYCGVKSHGQLTAEKWTDENNQTEKTMSKKELYKQKMQAQLDEWEAEVDSFKAKASGASADTQLELIKKINALKGKIEQGKAKLAEVAEASDDAWESIKGGVDSAMDSLKAAVNDAKAKLKG